MTFRRQLALLVAAFSLAACSSGSDNEDGGSNQAPVASAGGDLNVEEMTLVNLFGSGTDPDHANNELTFAWSQTGGSTVTINTPESAAASFTAPDVGAGNPETLTFALTVTDPGGLSSTDSVSVTVQEPGAVVTISGDLLYEFAAPQTMPMCRGLVFDPSQVRPIRRVTVQLLDEGETVLDTSVADDQGRYSLLANASTNVMIRVRAELMQSGSPSWNVEVRNNVVDPNRETVDPAAPALDERPLYVMDSAVFNSGTTDSERPTMIATTGWNGSGYDESRRVAAPFAILDSIYQAMLLILGEDPSANFPALDAYWSPDNGTSPRTGSFQDAFANGDLGVSFYFRGPTGDGSIVGPSLFLLGRDGDDTEEFDSHVIVHEWGHYFEDNFSRSDSIGGSHGFGDILDKRVAFGEGWATALSAIALDDPSYCDTLWFGLSGLTGFEINAENQPTDPNPGDTIDVVDGWFSETSVIKFVYDLWDTNADIDADTGSIGFGPIFDVMTGPQVFTEAFTSVFSFATELKQVSGEDAFIDALLTHYGINSNVDIWGSNETNDSDSGNLIDDVFPLYKELNVGVTERVCVNSQFDTGRDGNKLTEHRYLRFALASESPVTVTVTTVSADGAAPSSPADPTFDCTTLDPNDPLAHTYSDPDFYLWNRGDLYWIGGSCEPNAEVGTTGLLNPGTYVIDLNEFRHEDPVTVEPYPGRVCFDVTVQ